MVSLCGLLFTAVEKNAKKGKDKTITITQKINKNVCNKNEKKKWIKLF